MSENIVSIGLVIIGGLSFIGYLIWLIVNIVQIESKIPPIIGILLSIVMILGGVFTTQKFGGFLNGISHPSESQKSSPGNTSEKLGEDFLTEFEIKELYSNPNKYKNRAVELTGEVFSVPQYDYDKNAIYFQMFADPENSEMNTIVKYGGFDVEVSDGDFVRIQGTVFGEFNEKNAFGGTITGAQIIAESLEIISYQEAVAPALYTIVPENPTQTKYGYSVTIEKVEIAKQETRVYVKVENGGSDKFSLYSSSSVIIQSGNQYEERINYDAGYPYPQTNLNVGISTSGIVTYPPIENDDFKIIFEASSSNYDEDIESFEFDLIA